MIELYGAGGSRWAKPYWMLKELGIEFKGHVLNLLKGEQKTPEMLKMNPFGKAPVLKDGDFVLFESLAIINYLGEKYPASGLVPESGTQERALYDQWTSFCISDLEQPLWRVTKHSFIFPENLRNPRDIELAKVEFQRIAEPLDRILANRRYIVGERFTAADIIMAYTLRWAMRFELLNGFSNAQRYMNEMCSRPAFPRDLYE